MYISHVVLKNIRCFRKLELDLSSPAKTNKTLLLLGDNGVGKSTVLKSLAIGLCHRAGASGLLSDMYGSLITNGETKGSIEINVNQGRKSYTLLTEIKQSIEDREIEEIHKEIPPNFPWSQLFVCAYGPHRAMQGTNSYEEYAIADAVYTLFNYEWELQNPELVARRRGWDNKKNVTKLRKQLADILMVNLGDIQLTGTGWKIRNKRGHAVSFGSLADGHRSTMSWVLDLISWSHLAGRRADPYGIVLIDEIEQHLHPHWQRHILRLLSEQFPNIQFIVTSHSALCAAGVSEKSDRGFRIGEAHVLREEDSGSIKHDILPPMEGWAYDKVLSSYAFDIPSWPVPLEQALDAVRKHYDGPQSSSNSAFVKALSQLRELSLSEFASEQEKIKQQELDQELKRLLEARTRRAK